MQQSLEQCLKLLEGDFLDYNFGTAAEMLFTPCEIPDDDYDELELEPIAEMVAEEAVVGR